MFLDYVRSFNVNGKPTLRPCKAERILRIALEGCLLGINSRFIARDCKQVNRIGLPFEADLVSHSGSHLGETRLAEDWSVLEGAMRREDLEVARKYNLD